MSDLTREEVIAKLEDGCNLEQVDLNNLDLRNANFREADLTRTNFSGCNLSGANLSGTQFLGCCFVGANLTGINGSGVEWDGCYFSNANFSKAELEGADFGLLDFSGASFADANLQGAHFSGARMVDTNFKGASLKEAKFGIHPYSFPEKPKNTVRPSSNEEVRWDNGYFGLDKPNTIKTPQLDPYSAETQLYGERMHKLWGMGSEELWEAYQKNGCLWTTLNFYEFLPVDLRRAVFDNADFGGAVFVLSDLRGATFNGSNCTDALFFSVNINEEDLGKLSLRLLDISEASDEYFNFSARSSDNIFEHMMHHSGYSKPDEMMVRGLTRWYADRPGATGA